MYFNYFPKILYSLDEGRTGQVVTDIMRRTIVKEEYIKNSAFYDLHDIKDGETPEILSDVYYGSPIYYWVILQANSLIDPRFDWPLSQENLYEFCITKYGGETEIYKTKLYTNDKSNVVNGYNPLTEDSPNAAGEEIYLVLEDTTSLLLVDPPFTLYPVSRLEYETAINESKRRIKILKPEVVSEIVKDFGRIISR